MSGLPPASHQVHSEFSPLAEADLIEIGDYIAQDNPRRAESFIGELIDQVGKIARMPSAYLAREDLASGLRMCTHARYILFFRVLGDVVRVERVLHGRRDIDPDDFSV
ncbi:type II toxin-antitoxin system RelE/ParE family toxin [Variovorax ureilyticus]|uniref:type II toxin-antitoxin system RelE/ParE family toxin n=1 Tax=Variovorax ureilyticus TaxID=1836198 RepID=UPI003D67F91D